MKKINKITVICIICVTCIIIFFIGKRILSHKNISPNIDSKDYLTSKGDTASFKNKYNEKNFDNGTSFDFTKFTGKWSLIEFDSKKEVNIKLLDNSKITEGKVYILVLNSNYKDILVHKLNGKSVLNFCTPKDGKYFIRIVGENASGSFNIKIISNNNINISHKDIFQ